MRSRARRLVCRLLGHVAPVELDPVQPSGYTDWGRYVGDYRRVACTFCGERERRQA